MTPILSIKSLTKTYHEGPEPLVILNDLSLQVFKGDSIAICGPSGCGKSTLLSCLAGLVKADRGDVIFQNQNLLTLSGSALAELRAKYVGMIFQQFHLLPHLTALENVRFPLDLMGMSSEDAQAESLKSLDSVGLISRKDHFPHEMSRGECQRTAIARVFASHPTLILADEPTASLDSKSGELVLRSMLQLSEKHSTTVLLVTHDMKMAGLCQKQYQFTNGQLEEIRRQ